MTPLLFSDGRVAIRAQCPTHSVRINCDGLWLGAGTDEEESSQAGFQVTLRAAQDEAISTGWEKEYHSYHAKRIAASTLMAWIFPK
jgi:hypothetical protein